MDNERETLENQILNINAECLIEAIGSLKTKMIEGDANAKKELKELFKLLGHAV